MKHLTVQPNDILQLEATFGKYIKKSRICPICLRADHMEINALRGRDHLAYQEIMMVKQVTQEALGQHFKNHFILSRTAQQMLDLKEDNSSEANDLITRILDGEVDLFGALHSILRGRAQRLNAIYTRLDHLSDQQEIDNLTDIESQEFILLNRLVDGSEKDVMRIYELMEKKLLPSQEDTVKAILKYKLDILNKFVDNIIHVFIDFEKKPEFTALIQQLRIALAQKVSVIEASILQSGGTIITPAQVVVESTEEEQGE